MTILNLPRTCPSCETALEVTHMVCNQCNTKIEGAYTLPSILNLSREEQRLMIEFVKHNGSPQKLANTYGVSYPTIRAKIDKLIERLEEIS